ncbi:protein FAM183A [Polyodon spathula]|uniref:protein FAM183A n=1 Tax=Polyodon spathula TaxID=7913 RepID=UPI001B7F2D4F|nr:protein FAM183A [Polyodon spathula]
MTAANVKEPLNMVHQNAILCETTRKENRHQKLYTQFFINPYTNIHSLTGNPMSVHTAVDEEEPNFLKVIHRSRQEPMKKYTHPQTESQEIGWITTPLIDSDRTDRRLNFYRKNTELTNYMEVAWRLKEPIFR